LQMQELWFLMQQFLNLHQDGTYASVCLVIVLRSNVLSAINELHSTFWDFIINCHDLGNGSFWHALYRVYSKVHYHIRTGRVMLTAELQGKFPVKFLWHWPRELTALYAWCKVQVCCKVICVTC
jgi:hypothetical protein